MRVQGDSPSTRPGLALSHQGMGLFPLVTSLCLCVAGLLVQQSSLYGHPQDPLPGCHWRMMEPSEVTQLSGFTMSVFLRQLGIQLW